MKESKVGDLVYFFVENGVRTINIIIRKEIFCLPEEVRLIELYCSKGFQRLKWGNKWTMNSSSNLISINNNVWLREIK